MKFQIFRQRFTNHGVDDAAHLSVAQLCFGLAFEFRVGHLDRQHRGQPFADVLTGKVAISFFALTAFTSKHIEGAGEHRLEAFNMGAAINSADVVGKAKNAVGVGINAPLQSSFHLHPIFLCIDINDVGVERILLRIHISDILSDAALVEIDLFPCFAVSATSLRALVAEDDLHPAIEIGQLPQSTGQGLVVKADADREDLDIRLEAHRRAGPSRLARL